MAFWKVEEGRGISGSVPVSRCLVGFVLLKLAFMEDFKW